MSATTSSIKSVPASSSVLRAILILIGTTGFEVAGLILWFEFDLRGSPGLGLLILFFGLVLERLVVTGIPRELEVWLIIIGSSVWEYAAWALWFTLIQTRGLNPFAIFALVLLPGLHFQHAFLSSIKLEKSFGELSRNVGFIIFGLIEAIGGGLWLALLSGSPTSTIPAHLLIIIAITIEHIVQGVVLDGINNKGTLRQMSRAN